MVLLGQVGGSDPYLGCYSSDKTTLLDLTAAVLASVLIYLATVAWLQAAISNMVDIKEIEPGRVCWLLPAGEVQKADRKAASLGEESFNHPVIVAEKHRDVATVFIFLVSITSEVLIPEKLLTWNT